MTLGKVIFDSELMVVAAGGRGAGVPFFRQSFSAFSSWKKVRAASKSPLDLAAAISIFNLCMRSSMDFDVDSTYSVSVGVYLNERADGRL